MKVLIVTVLVALLVAASFFATTWLVMILAGMAGHFVDSQWLKQLSFWECAPVWVAICILKLIFK